MSDTILLKVATTREERRAFQQLLFQIYCQELGWHDPAKFPDSAFTDEYDSESIFLTVISQNDIIAGLRLVPDTRLGFPHEKEFNISLPFVADGVRESVQRKLLQAGRTRIREITRLIGRPTGKRVLAIDLMKCLYWYGRHNSISIYFMAVDMNLFLLCHKLSIPLCPVGVPRYCEGSWTIPAVMILEEVQASLEQRNQKAWSYIADPSNLVGAWSEQRVLVAS